MPSELRFYLLGSVSIALGDDSLSPMRSRSAEALLIYLALHKKTFSRQVLADFFWDERSQKQALSNLRTVLAMLRRRLPDHLLITRHTVAFDHDAAHWLDVTPFQMTDPSTLLRHAQVDSLQSHLALYRADFLSGFSLPHSQGFEQWSLLLREQLRQRAVSMLHHVVAHFIGHAEYDRALPHAHRLLELNPLDDLAHRRLMELLWRSGQRSAALQQYAAARELLAQELDAAPDPATIALYERLRSAPFPPPCRLPALPGEFVGRRDELSQLTALLDDPAARLITIVGPGGMGKTRLLLEAARRSAAARPGRFIDGVYFVPLSALASTDFLPTTLAQQLGLTLQGSAGAFEQLLDHLRPRELLLALDNVEHLLTTRSRRWLARIAHEAPAVRLLLSSRARLGLQGERLLELGGLAPASAERLFIARAASVHPAFAPDADERAAITRLCRLVDGMPLALELAAAGVRTLSCDAIAEQLQARLDWQFDHFPDRPRRHQNLQAVFDHSWGLLAPDERQVAMRLGVFTGPFDAAGARAVAGATPMQLATLRDQSLLAAEQPGWFNLHPLVRRFLCQKQQDDPVLAQETARRHVDYIVALRSRAGGSANMESAYHAMKQIMDRQHDQVIAAALWLARRRDFSARKLVTLVESLIFYYKHGSQFESWKVTFEAIRRALAQGQGEEDNAAWLSAVLRSRIAEADLDLHAYERAQAQFEALLPRARALQNGALISFCHHKLGELASRRADFPAAYEHLAAALPPLDDEHLGPHYYFHVHRTWTEVALLAGDLSQARAAAETAYALALKADSKLEAEPIYLWALGEIARCEGNPAQARTHLQRALQLAAEKGYWRDEVNAGASLASVHAALGQGAVAAELAAAAYDNALSHHDPRLMAIAARAQGHAAASRDDSPAARAYFQHSHALLSKINDRAELARTPEIA